MTNGFRWYVGSSYRPNEFTVEGSNNELQWTQIYSGASENSTGWKEFGWNWTEPYLFYRWTITSRHSTYIYLYEIELSVGIGNERAFTVSGMQRDSLKYGNKVPIEYTVDFIERYLETDDTILLYFDTYNRFCDVEGDIIVAYNQTKGNLTGTRSVEDFTENFAPEGLEPTPVHEHTLIARSSDLLVDFIPVVYEDVHEEHILTARLFGLFVDFVHVDDIIP